MTNELIERLAREAEKPVNFGSGARRFVNVEVLAAMVAEECAEECCNGVSAEEAQTAIRAKFPMPGEKP